MIEFVIEDWVAAEGIALPEHRATWARLSIHVDGKVVTKVEDARAHTVRDAIYVPLYPLAEWLSTHWFIILHEPRISGRRDDTAFHARHTIRSAGDGFAWPDLQIVPEGPQIQIAWSAVEWPAAGLRYRGEGAALKPRTACVQAFGAFVDTVLDRLNDELPGHRTLLHDEWESLRQLPEDECTFCEAAGSMGLDPFDLDESQEQAILSVWHALPAELRPEFFAATPYAELGRHVEWLSQGRDLARQAASAGSRRAIGDPEIFEVVRPVGHESEPWRAGHACARAMRKRLGLDDGPVDNAVLDERLQFESAISFDGEPGYLEGLSFRAESGGRPSIVMAARHHPASRRFVFARTVFEALARPAGEGLVTRALTDAQSRSRAFAAEFLVPEAGLRKCLSAEVVGPDEIGELAAEFEVSEWVIQHQIQNHNLARIDQPVWVSSPRLYPAD